MKDRVQVLIPAYDEAANLPYLFARLFPALDALRRPWELLIVDDGSTDETGALIGRLSRGRPVSVVHHSTNLGPGAAFVTGFCTLLDRVSDQAPIITLEADGTSDLTILPEMLSKFEQGADVVLASVYHPRGGLRHTAAYRRVLSGGANWMLRTLLDMPDIYTFSSFYRIYRAEILRRALNVYGLRLIEEPGFAAVVELLVRLRRMGARIEEVPMILDSTRRKGTSRMRVGRTVRGYLRVMARERLAMAPVRQMVETELRRSKACGERGE